MNDKTEQALTDALRLAAKSAAPYSTAMIGASHLNEAANTIDILRAQLAEQFRELIAKEAERAARELECDNAQRQHTMQCAINKTDSQRILELTAQLAEAQRDSERLDWMIEQRAYVVSDPDCCDGYWLNYQRHDGTLWVQTTEHETPRAAIDAAMGEPS